MDLEHTHNYVHRPLVLLVCLFGLWAGLCSLTDSPLSAYPPVEIPSRGSCWQAGSVGAALHACEGQVFIAFTHLVWETYWVKRGK